MTAQSSPPDGSDGHERETASIGPGETAESDRPEFDVPDEEQAVWCDYCGRPFADRHLWALHLGDRHAAECTEAEQTVVADATDEELDELFVFHIKVVAALTLLYAVIVLVYMIVLGWG